jgi:HD-GYP domain-containing protein (c-di-GMP phosphodiesterase class II)
MELSARVAEAARPLGEVEARQILGRELVLRLSVSVRMAKLHDPQNAARLRAEAELSGSLEALFHHLGGFRLTVVGDYLFLDDQRLRVDAVGFAAFDHFIKLLRARRIGEMHMALQPTREELTDLVQALLVPPAEDDPFQAFRLQSERMERWVGFSALPDNEPEAVSEKDPRERARRAFLSAVTVTRLAMARTRMGRGVDFRAAQRVVQGIVDLLMEEEFSLLGLTVLRDYDAYTFHHSVNVCIFSVVLGKRLGLTRRELGELGVAALFHDIGKVTLPRSILDKPGRFNAEEWERMKRHPMEGARLLLRLGGMSRLAMQSVLVAFEHHQRHDLSGYPPLRIPRPQHILSRIVSIADCFDAMSAERPYRERSLRREEILGHMMAHAGTHFDPLLLKLFVNAVGVYPIGTVLELSGGVWAVVTGSAPREALDRPRVRVVRDASGAETRGPEIDLACSEIEVTGTVDPDEHGLELADCFQ